MSVLDLQIPEETTDKPAVVCPKKVIVLALSRDHRGIRAKIIAETLHKRFPNEYHKPLVKFFHDVGWRDTLNRLRKASKKWDYIAPVIVFVNKKLVGDDDDFNLFVRQNHFLLADPKKIIAFRNMSLLDKLQMDPLKTYVYFDISIDYRPCGRMIFQIEEDTMPESTKDFLKLCCSQKIPLPTGQFKRSRFAGSLIKRIVRDGWIRIDTIDDERTYAKGKYEKPALTHNRRGVLSMNVGPRGWTCSHIVITLEQHPWMDKLYRAIGVLIDGEHVLHMMENVETTYENPNIDVVITDNGILYSPSLMATQEFLNPDIKEAAEKLQAFRDEYKSVLAAYVNTVRCIDPNVKVKPKTPLGEEKGENGESNSESDEDLQRDPTLSSFEPASQASLLASKSQVAGFSASHSKVAIWSRTERQQSPLGAASSFRENASKRSSALPSLQSELMATSSKKTIQSPSTRPGASSRMVGKEMSSKAEIKSLKTTVSTVVSQHGELEEEEAGEEAAMKPVLSEPDIEYTYTVPQDMLDVRTAYKKFRDGKRPEQFQKLGMKLPKKDKFGDRNQQETEMSLVTLEPHQRANNDELIYYGLSKNAMAQVTPNLLLAWAQGIDDDAEVLDIQNAVNDLVNAAIHDPHQLDVEGHPLDAVSMEDTRERFRKCMLSLPTQLLQMLYQAMHDIFERQEDGAVPLTVTGESTSKVEIVSDATKKMKAASEDVISGIMFSLIDFTKRMIESSTELIPNMKNLDYVKSIINEVILEKVHNFLDMKRPTDMRFKKKLPYEFFTPGDPNVPYMKNLRKTKGGISYFLEADHLPKTISNVSEAAKEYFAELSAKRLPIHVKDPQRPSSV